MALDIFIDNDSSNFTQGQTLSGEIQWNMERAPRYIKVNLYWYTEGKGDTESEVVSTADISTQKTVGSARFNFTLPRGPYSFAGKLVSINWAVEFLIPEFNKRSAYAFNLCDSCNIN